MPIEAGITVVMYTDGLAHAGERMGDSLDVCSMIKAYLDEQEPSAQYIADSLLAQALRLDLNQPNDDMSVIALRVINKPTDHIRRMSVRLPVIKTNSLD